MRIEIDVRLISYIKICKSEQRRPFHIATITRLNPFSLSAYGLSARCPTLKALCYHSSSKDLLARWLARLSGAGFPPAGLRDLARPHVKGVPITKFHPFYS